MPDVASNLHRMMEKDRAAAFSSWDLARLRYYRDYAKGKQTVSLTREQRRVLQGLLGHLFADNICRKILNVAAGRVVFRGWDVDDKAVQNFLDMEVWAKNKVGRLQSQITYATLRDGNSVVGLRWEPDVASDVGGRVFLSQERWWDGKSGIFIDYDDFGVAGYACKEWEDVDDSGKVVKRRTFYFPNFLQRFIQEGGGWVPLVLDDSDNAGVVPWVKENGDPLGLPVVHFAHSLQEDASPYGLSDLSGGVLAFQDQINAVQYDITAAAMYAGYQMTYSTGTQLKTDPDTGLPIPPTVGPGQHFHADEDSAHFGTIPPGDLSQLTTAYMTKVQAVCRMTDTPLHFITGQWPSGEALLRAEIDLVEKARRLVENVGPAWVEVGHRCTEIANALGVANLDESAQITANFADPQRRDIMTMAQVANAEAEYTSKRERLRMTGRTTAEIEQIFQEMQEEQDLASTALARAIGSGNPAVTGIDTGA